MAPELISICVRRSAAVLAQLLFVVCICAPLDAQSKNAPATGLLWNVQGVWRHAGGALVLAGDAVLPGELLQPDVTDHAHSVIVLLPDGQRLHYACFNQADCVRGFRVPALAQTPTAFEAGMLDGMRSMFAQGATKLEPPRRTPARTTPPAKDEAVLLLNADNEVRLTGLAATLPRGDYTYDLLRRVIAGSGDAGPLQHHLPLEKKDGPAVIPLPAAGLYELRIVDETDRPRINLFLVVVATGEAKKFASFVEAEKTAKETLDEWNDHNPGWPSHDLLRLYLMSLAQSGATR